MHLHRQTFIPIEKVIVRNHAHDDTIIEIVLIPKGSVDDEEIVIGVHNGIDLPAPEVIVEGV